MEKFNLSMAQKVNKKGSATADNAIDVILAVVIIFALLGGVATQVFGMNLTASGAPSWVNPLLITLAVITIVYSMIRLSKGKK